MTLQECYEKLGGDYDAVLGRLRQEERVERFMLLYTRDDNYVQLCQSIEAKDWALAFRAAHSLKGVGLNLGFAALAKSAAELTEALRGGEPSQDPAPLLEQVTKDHERTMAAIEEYKAGKQ